MTDTPENPLPAPDGTAAVTAPSDMQTVTVAPGCFVRMQVIGGHDHHPQAVDISIRAEGGTTIGVPSVAVRDLRAQGLVV